MAVCTADSVVRTLTSHGEDCRYVQREGLKSCSPGILPVMPGHGWRPNGTDNTAERMPRLSDIEAFIPSAAFCTLAVRQI